MTDVEIQHFRLSESEDAEVVQYRAISGLAVAALIAGLLAPLATFDPFLWMVPVVGILLSVLALRQIAREAPARVGRKPALAGLILSVLCVALATSQWVTNRWLIDAEARRFAMQWFDFLRQGEPEKAVQLGRHPAARPPLDDQLWDAYAPGTEDREELEAFVSRSEIRALLALGKEARVRYYDTEGQWRQGGGEMVRQVFAVTYHEAGQKKSFFVGVTSARFQDEGTGHAHWQVTATEGGIRPKALGG